MYQHNTTGTAPELTPAHDKIIKTLNDVLAIKAVQMAGSWMLYNRDGKVAGIIYNNRVSFSLSDKDAHLMLDRRFTKLLKRTDGKVSFRLCIAEDGKSTTVLLNCNVDDASVVVCDHLLAMGTKALPTSVEINGTDMDIIIEDVILKARSQYVELYKAPPVKVDMVVEGDYVRWMINVDIPVKL